jgi:hypothetical protein
MTRRFETNLFVAVAVVALCRLSYAQMEAVWCPLFDWNTSWSYLTPDKVNNLFYQNPNNNPDIAENIANGRTDYDAQLFNSTTHTGLIKEALDKAWSKGITTIDMPFFIGSRHPYPAPTPPAYSAWYPPQRIAEQWIRAIEDYNTRPCNSAKQFRLRIRFLITAQHLYVYNNEYLNDNNPATLPNPITGWLPFTDFTPLEAFGEDGQRTTNIPDLGQPDVVNAIALFAQNAIDEIQGSSTVTGYAPHTVLSMVTLVFPGTESCLAGSGTGLVGFTGMVSYNASWPFEKKVFWFKQREKFIHDTYKAFTDAVHSKININNQQIQSGIFYQGWPFDNQVRGSFDTYTLFKGTGVDRLHFTTGPVVCPIWSGEVNPRMATVLDFAKETAVAATMINRINSIESRNMRFDTEFSWPMYPNDCNEQQSLIYNGLNITAANAAAFRAQADAGRYYNAAGITYCNWPRYDIAHEPGRGLSSPTPGQWSVVRITALNRYQFLRFVAPSTASPCYMAEMEFYSNDDCLSKLTGSIFGTTGTTNHGRTSAVDNSTSTYYESSPDPNPGFVGINVGAANITQIAKIRFFPAAGHESQMAGGRFQGAQLQAGPYTNLYEIPAQQPFPTASSISDWNVIYSQNAVTALTNNTPAINAGSQPRAIYISTVGKMWYETTGGFGAGYGQFLKWFTHFGLAPEANSVDIITDAMIIDNPAILDNYTEIYLPYETSRYVDYKVSKILVTRSSSVKGKFRYQTQPDQLLVNMAQNLNNWLNWNVLKRYKPADASLTTTVVR